MQQAPWLRPHRLRPARTRQDVAAETAHQILKRISDEDARKLGFDPQFTRPDWMVITVLPVPPPQVRPSIQMESSQGRGEDDLTVKLQARAAARVAGSGWRVVRSAGGGVTAAWEAEARGCRPKAAETAR